MNVILGFNAFHADSAACLVVDGKLVGAVAEERLGARIKHSSDFPEHAIRHLLRDSGIRLRDVTHVAVARDPSANYAAKLAYTAKRPTKAAGAVVEHFRRNKETKSVTEKLAMVCDEPLNSISFEVVEVEHHLAHIASAYFLSPFESLTAGLSYDGSGDFASMMVARCENNRISVLDRVTLPDSLGFFYTAICQFIGFDHFGEEYKVMGLAPYGENYFADEMSKLVELEEDGWFQLGKGYFDMHSGGKSGATDDAGHVLVDRLYTDKFIGLFGEPRRRDDPITQRDKNIARSAQIRFEEAAINCLRTLHKRVPSEQIVMAGGCALNGVANARILRETPFTKPYLQAAASDDGTCLGAAYYVWHQVLGMKERFHMSHAFWGPKYDTARCRRALEVTGLRIDECADDEELVALTSELIAKGEVVGWYQGRSEWGPRALGNRSILANPAIPAMKDIINSKIKRRESFRPFAPSVLSEDVGKYFEQDVYSPFMMHVVKLRPEWRTKLPAITHVDGTGRLQSVDRSSNELYHKLITKVKEFTGVGMVLNTSFNENEPVVDTPEQAVACFMRTDMDVLVLDRLIVQKRNRRNDC